MTDAPSVQSSIVFFIASVLFAGVAGYLVLNVVGNGIDASTAFFFYLPILVCWIGMSRTRQAAPSLAIGSLALAWTFVVFARTRSVNSGIDRRLSDARIEECLSWLKQHPEDGEMHYKLAEAYENRGWRREAYQEYAAAAELTPGNKRARIRARDLYKEITGKALRDTPTAAAAPTIQNRNRTGRDLTTLVWPAGTGSASDAGDDPGSVAPSVSTRTRLLTGEHTVQFPDPS